MRVICISGSRKNYPQAGFLEILNELLDQYDPTDTVLLHGGAQGVDTWVSQAATRRTVPFHVAVMPALWDGVNRETAGPIRNNMMAQMADEVWCFRADEEFISPGTDNMRAVATHLGILTEYYVANENRIERPEDSQIELAFFDGAVSPPVPPAASPGLTTEEAAEATGGVFSRFLDSARMRREALADERAIRD